MNVNLEVITWNVHRLFSPTRSRLASALGAKWSEAAFATKLARVAAVLRAILHGRTPGLVALCELADAGVVRVLLAAIGKRELVSVRIPGERREGLDVVLLYSREHFEPAGPAERLHLLRRHGPRDVLAVPLRTARGAELLVVANHWPSRLLPEGEAFRLAAAGQVSRRIQAWRERRRRSVIVLGALNDEPGDPSVRAVLGATRERPVGKGNGRRWNPGWALLGGARGPSGSCFFGGDVWLFDQMVVSEGMLRDGAITWDAEAFRVAGAAELGEAGGPLLSRSGRPVGFEPTRGTGVSDHLPVVGRIGIAA